MSDIQIQRKERKTTLFVPPWNFAQQYSKHYLHCKKELAVFQSPAGMSLIKLFLGGDNSIFPAQGEFGQ